MSQHEQAYGQATYDELKPYSQDNPTAHFIEQGSVRDRELRKMKKFRFQLLHRWLVEHFEPCRVADIGGGKGLFAYLMQQSGWTATVIDPIHQELPHKYKDIATGKRIKVPPTDKVPHFNSPFDTRMGDQFDLLVGMHAHGSNAMIIDAAKKYGCGFVLFPCCVIDEPFYPIVGTTWLKCLAGYAQEKEQTIYPFRLNFKGQNIGMCGLGSGRVVLKDAMRGA
jgi:hypothetical protein